MRQISPESEGIFDLIVALYKSVDGDWGKLGKETGVSAEDVHFWVEYAAGVVGNAGNYKVIIEMWTGSCRWSVRANLLLPEFRRREIHTKDLARGIAEACFVYPPNKGSL